MGKAFNDRGTKVVINGHEATRTRRAGSPAGKRTARKIKSAELRDTVLRMTLERVPQLDIARALNLTQPRVSQILKEAWEERQPERAQTIERARQMALMECDLHASPWMKRARTSPRAAEVLLSWLTRSDRIQGLYQQNNTLSIGSVLPKLDEPPTDLSRLTLDELNTLHRLLSKAQGLLEPTPESVNPGDPGYTPTIAPWAKASPSTPALLEQQDDASIVAVVDREETLREKILRLNREGMTATAIIQSLAITHAEFIEALEGPGDTIQ